MKVIAMETITRKPAKKQCTPSRLQLRLDAIHAPSSAREKLYKQPHNEQMAKSAHQIEVATQPLTIRISEPEEP